MNNLCNYKYLSSSKCSNQYISFFVENPLCEWNLNHFIDYWNARRRRGATNQLEGAYGEILEAILQDRNVPDGVKDVVKTLRKSLNSGEELKRDESGTSTIYVNQTIGGDYIGGDKIKVIADKIELGNEGTELGDQEEQQQGKSPEQSEQAQPEQQQESGTEDLRDESLSITSVPSREHVRDSTLNNEEEDLTLISTDITIPTQDDRYVVNNVDISMLFYNFQLYVKNLVNNKRLFMESHVHHILAMSSVLLIKPKCINDDLKMFIDDKTTKCLVNAVKEKLGVEKKEFNVDLMHKMIKTINDVRKGKLDRMEGVMKLYTMKPSATKEEAKIIVSIANMLTKLPEDTLMEDTKELELITRYIDPALHPLFDDLGNGIMFRWTSTNNLESKKASSISISQRRPDSSISKFDGVHLGLTLGFGEVKCHGESKNHYAIAKDLVRLGIFTKNAIDIGKLKGVLSFQAIGK
ncbi:hypothetical protein EC973_005261 [Apophysomyces ossiformis]|uniref:Uncharacterized protein n=1 Tax=Apophysomyces ossiformis TaxID=679940 RepID=A0A8H7EVH6_9FUNG|nr:hypothetical protein EC973_005261 [Apophysomyces ossiformis]